MLLAIRPLAIAGNHRKLIITGDFRFFTFGSNVILSLIPGGVLTICNAVPSIHDHGLIVISPDLLLRHRDNGHHHIDLEGFLIVRILCITNCGHYSDGLISGGSIHIV